MLPMVRKVKEEITPTMTGIVMKKHLGRPTEREILGGIVKVHPKKVEDISLLPLKEVESRKPAMPPVSKCDTPKPKTKGLYGMTSIRTI